MALSGRICDNGRWLEVRSCACGRGVASNNENILVLASSSPRRRELLARAGVKFEVVPPPVEEPSEVGRSSAPMRQALALAYFKARAVWELHPTRWVLGADTIVAVKDKILGKPADADHARSMLGELSSFKHAVITGVALLGPDGRRSINAAVTYVTMRKMSPEEIEQYIVLGEWIGKAGAYAIQESADRFVERLEGSFTNVVGMPMELVMKMLLAAGVAG